MPAEPTFHFDDAGVLRVDFGPAREQWREPNCAVCGESIRWVLDMASWTERIGGLAHARCVWLPEAFAREAEACVPSSDVAGNGE